MRTFLYYSPLILFILGVLCWTIWYARKTIAAHPTIRWVRALLTSLLLAIVVGPILGGLTYVGTGISGMDSSPQLTSADLTGMIASWFFVCIVLCFALMLRNMSSKPPP